MTLYAAADSPLPELPESLPPNPLSVRRIKPEEEGVRARFTKPHVYFIGSHTGCSCGFQYGPYVDQDREGRQSVAQLGAYLADAIGKVETIELYARWIGDELEGEDHSETLTPDSFSASHEAFDLKDRWFATVVDRRQHRVFGA